MLIESRLRPRLLSLTDSNSFNSIVLVMLCGDQFTRLLPFLSIKLCHQTTRLRM